MGSIVPRATLFEGGIVEHTCCFPASDAIGGGRFRRAIDAVLADVVAGYVSLEGAERDYGVVIRYTGTPEQLVRLPEHYAVDEEATARLRGERA
jgi:hypothetical protein